MPLVVPVVVVVVQEPGNLIGSVPEAPEPAAAIATRATTNNSTPSPSAMTFPSWRDAPVICVNNGKWSSGMTSTSGRSLFYVVNGAGKALQRPTEGRLCREAPRTRAEIPADGVVGRQDEAWPSRRRRGCQVSRRMAVLTAHH